MFHSFVDGKKKAHHDRNETFEYVLNITREHKIRNDIIRTRAEVTLVLNYFQKQQATWYGYINDYCQSVYHRKHSF